MHSPCYSLQHPSSAVTTKKFSYLLVKTGTLMLKSCTDMRGYIPGQVIKLATEIHNKSGKDTGCVLASLIQVNTPPQNCWDSGVSIITIYRSNHFMKSSVSGGNSDGSFYLIFLMSTFACSKAELCLESGIDLTNNFFHAFTTRK